MHEIEFTVESKAKAIAEVTSYIDSLKPEKQYKLTIEEIKKKRSLTSNSYAWVMIGQIAERIHESKIEVYRGYVRNIGGNSDVFLLDRNAVDRFIETWQSFGMGYVCDILTEYENEDGEEKTEVMAYYGSHTYNQEQMNNLINLIVQDCEVLGIPTKDPAELEQLVKEWGIE